MMREALAIGWLMVAATAGAAGPMDLSSPFEKVALVKVGSGEIEKREIKKARLVGESVEMEKMEGGVAIFPARDVVAILPRLPKEDLSFTPDQADLAIRIIQGADGALLKQAGLDDQQQPAWEKFKESLLVVKNQKDKKERKEREGRMAKEVQDWLARAGDIRASRTAAELTALRQSGEALARKNPEQMEVILEALATLSQVQPKEKGPPLPELGKLQEVQPSLIPDDLLGWLAGGVLLLSFFGLLFGLAFLSSSQARFKEGAWLGGVLFGLVGLGLLGLLIWTWLPTAVSGRSIPARTDTKMEELGMYLKNKAKPVYYFPAKQFSFSPEEWQSGILGYLAPSDESVGFLKVKMKGGHLRVDGNTWTWQQPLTALGIPLPFSLTFAGKSPDLKNWECPEISKVYLGRWLLPDLAAGLLKDSALGIWSQGLASAGLAGVKLESKDAGSILVSVPAGGVRPKYELAKEEKQKGAVYRKEISAEELAQEFAQGHGEEFLGKFVLLEGFVERVESGSEVSGASSASKQGDLPKGPGSSTGPGASIFGQGSYDSFYLATGAKPIRCLIKSALVFVQDERKDIYVGPSADTISREPFIKKGYRVKFMTDGRVEEVNRFGEIEVYGIRLDPDKLKEQIKIFDPNGVQTN